MSYIPIVHDRSSGSADIYSKLLHKGRIIFLTSGIDDAVATAVCAQLLYLESESHEKDVHMYINSPGGSVTAALAIYDTMQSVSPDVATYCFGQAASAGAMLFAAGAKGKRFILPHARTMIHQPHVQGGIGGQETDIRIQAKEIGRLKGETEKIIAFHTGQQLKVVQADMERDAFKTAMESIEYGIADKLLNKKVDDYKGA